MQRTMKAPQRVDDTSQNCSCTSCVYKNGPDRFSLGRIKNRSSRIDKLAQHKNIPLRKKQLIEKLIKTRAVYDDLRQQLLSESNITVNEANLKTRKREAPRDVDNIEKSVILQLVNLVDKGMTLESNELNNCCSCCSCSSQILLHDNVHKSRKHIRHARAHSGPNLTSKSNVKQRQRKEPKSRRSASFKIKRIRSEPCRCTLKFSDLLGHQSNLFLTQKSPEQPNPMPKLTPGLARKYNLRQEKHKKSLQNIGHSKTVTKYYLESGVKKSGEVISDLLERRSQLHPQINSDQLKLMPKITPVDTVTSRSHERDKNFKKYPSICKCARKGVEEKFKKSLEKLKYSKRIMKGHLQSGAGKSVEKLKLVKVQIKDRIQSMQSDYVKYSMPLPVMVEKKDAHRFISGKKGGITKDKIPVGIKEMNEYRFFSVNNGGIANSKKEKEEHQEKTEEQPIFKLRKDSITKFKEKLKRKQNLHDYECEPACFPEKCIPEECFEKIKRRKARRDIRLPQMPAKNKKKETIIYPPTSDINILVKEDRTLVRHPTGTPVKIKNRKHNVKTVNRKQKSTEMSIKSNKIATSGYTLKRCFCTLKLKPKPARRVVNKGIVTSSVVILDQMSLRPQKINIRRLLPYECEPGICVPNECDPSECLKMISQKEGQHIKRHIKYSNTEDQKTRSTSSFTSRSFPRQTKKAQSNIFAYKTKIETGKDSNRKQPTGIRTLSSGQNGPTVRIGSNFSFNIEFIKENPLHTSTSPIIERESNIRKDLLRKPKLKQGGFQGGVRRNQNESFMQTEKKEFGTFGTASKRCFCTLDLIKNVKERSNTNHTSTETNFLEITPSVRRSKATKTKEQKIKYIKQLKPFECEPNVCVPGECIPYKCFERIKKREKLLLKEFGTTTYPSKMKSISNMTQNFEKSKSTLAQSKLRQRHMYTKSSNKKPARNIPLSISSMKQKSKQAVTIGSTFSFNIEFSKSRSLLESRLNILRKENFEPIRKARRHGTGPKKSSVLHQNQQVKGRKKVNKVASMKPILKRCFCTLKLQNKNNNPHVLAVSRLLVGKTKIKNQETTLADEDTLYREIQFPKYEFKFKEMKEYFHKNTPRSLQGQLSRERCLRIENDSHFEIKRNLLNYCTYSEGCFTKSKKVIKSICFNKPLYSDNEIQYKRNEFVNLNISRSDVTGVNPLLKRCYCTMNILMPNITRHDKLKSYECEPGICIPNECNPYECQKLIMKRLMRKSSTMSETDTKSVLSHGSQFTTSSKAKRLQSGKRPHEKKKTTSLAGIKYSLPSKANKKAVRMGSSFSFNIEFSKDKLQSHYDGSRYKEKIPAMCTKPVKTVHQKPNAQGTSKLVDSYTQDSQTINIKTRDMQSSTSAMLKRCFCTLKLQKAGKQKDTNKSQKNIERNRDQVTMTKRQRNYEVFKPSTVSITQNMKTVRPEKLSYDLKPYECEPYTCVPGDCDPYECLERIKLRNVKFRNVGSGLEGSKTKSTSSAIRKYKTHSKGKQTRSRFGNKTEGTKEISSKKPRPIRQSSNRQPSRQANRIGSSFSFNIEFYKSTMDSSEPIPVEMEYRDKIHLHKKEAKKRTGHNKHKTKGLSSQDKKGTHNKYSQQGNSVTNVKSIMTTSFTQRCFCTKNLHAIGKKNAKNILSSRSVIVGTKKNRSRHLIKKCLCVLKLLAISSKKALPRAKLENLRKLDKGQVTERIIERKSPKLESKECEPGICVLDKCDSYVCDKIIKQRKWRLEPYECEPGICVPGNCDPYVCDKIIKQRKWKQHVQTTNTNKPRTKSSASSYKSKVSKANRIQTSLKLQQKKTVKSTTNTASSPSEQVKIRKNSFISKPSTRQVVRIGSNFNFNVEFYRERSPSADQIQIAAKAIAPPKKLKRSVSQKSGESPKMRNIAMYDKGGTMLHRHSQAGIQTAERSTGSALKRCFCTLKLQNPLTNTVAPVKDVPKTYDKGVMIVEKYKQILEPYECEPNICIPGECDPQECLKRINKRKLRESGTITKRHKAKSASSMAYTTSNNRNTQIARKKYKNADVKTKSRKFDDKYSKSRKSIISTLTKSSKQSVKLGSSFSFNIDFFKETPHDENFKPKMAKPQRMKQMDSVNIATNRNKMSQGAKFLHHRDSRILAGKRRDKMTGVHPALKRCFCTLKFQKSNEIASQPIQGTVPNKIKFGPISKDMRNNIVYLAALHPYECEPGVCVPYECDPIICEKRIRQRMVKSKETNTNKTKLQTSSSSYPYPRNAPNSTQRPREQRVKNFDTQNLRRYKKSESSENRPSSSTDHHVRFGSNFTIGIDFYKDSSVSEPSRILRIRDVPVRRKDNIQRKKTRIQDFSGRRKPNIQRKETITETKNRDKSFDPQRKQHHSIATAVVPKTASQYSSIRPLKRCFCTLKLHQAAKIDQELKKKPYSLEKGTKTHRIKTYEKEFLKTKSTGVGTKKVRVRNLEPYECEPNVCIPGQCDPNKCYERIKRCQVRKSGVDIGKNHVGVEAIQVKKGLHHFEPYECEPNVCVPGQCDPYKCLERINRRRVRDLGTSTRKTLKNVMGASDNVSYKSTGTQSAVKRKAKKLIKQKGRREICVCTKEPCSCPPYPKNIKVTELSAGDWPNPQRYIFIQDVGSAKILSKHGYRKTKEKYKYNKTNDDTEDHNEKRKESTTTERIKEKIKKKIKTSRRAKINEGHQKVYRIGSKFSIDLEFYKVQSQNDAKEMKVKIPEIEKGIKVSKLHQKTGSNNMEKLHRSSQMRSGKLHQGSQIHFPKLHRNQDSQMHSRTMDHGAQIRSTTKDKEIGMTFLKRCFCTAPPQLRDKLENRLRNTTITDTHYQSPSFMQRCFCTLKLLSAKKKENVIAVHRVAVQEEKNMFHIPNALHKTDTIKENKYVGNKWQGLKNDLNENLDGIIGKNKVFCYCVNCDYNEMKTIYPYVPRKFNKHVSKTIVSYEHDRRKAHWDRRVHFIDRIKQPNITSFQLLTKQHRKLTAKQSSTSINVLEKRLNFKAILYRFMRKLKHNKLNIGNQIAEDVHTPLFNKKQRKYRIARPVKVQNDILKPSYSDRCPIVHNDICDPKKTKSLKISTLHGNTEVIKKKYSRFQSGDSAQTSGIPTVHNSHRIYDDSIHNFNRCNCTYSKIDYSKIQRATKVPMKSVYADNKLVQFSLITPDKNNSCKGKCNECTKLSTLDKKGKMICDPRCKNMKKTPRSEIKTAISNVSDKERDIKCLHKYISIFKTKCLKNPKSNNKEEEETCVKDPCYDRKEKCTATIPTSSNKGKSKIYDKANFLNPTSLNNVNGLQSRSKGNPKEPRVENKQKGKAFHLINNLKRKSSRIENYQNGKHHRWVNNQNGIMNVSSPLDAGKPATSNKDNPNITDKANIVKTTPLDVVKGLRSKDKNNQAKPRLSNKQKGIAFRLVKNLKHKDFRTENYQKEKNHRWVRSQKGNMNVLISPDAIGEEGMKIKPCICVLNKTRNQASNDVPLERRKCSPCCQQICSHGVHPDPFNIMKPKKPLKPLGRGDLCQCLSCKCHVCPKKNKTSELSAGDWPNPQRYIFIDMNNAETMSEPKNKKNIDANKHVHKESDGTISRTDYKKELNNNIDAYKYINKNKGGTANVTDYNKIINSHAKFWGISKIKQHISNIFTNVKDKICSFRNVDNSSKACHICSVLTDEKTDHISGGPTRKGKRNICKCVKENKKEGTRGGEKRKNISTAKKKKVGIDKTCTCGSKVCKKHFNQISALGLLGPGRKSTKPCKCGTVICKSEREKQEKRSLTKEQRKLLALQKKNFKLQLGRAAKYKIEDEERKIRQIKKDQILSRQLRKDVKTSSNWGLVGESIIDIAKLGCRTKKSVLRCAARTITDPKNVLTSLKTSIRDPKKMVGNVDNAFSTIGFGPTFRRVGTRLCATTPAVSMMNTLEDKFNLQAIGGKKRKKKRRKAKRRQPPVDFACSLFMASLRKKPCLAVYYACPWFYPHCLSFLTIWKQFTDILLFLLAVTVWSPCILAMEICRAFVCCTFCTG